MGKIRSLIYFDGKVDNLVGTKGKDGNYTVRKHQPRPRNARTALQMPARVRWSGVVSMWKAFQGMDKPSFEGRKKGQSNFNAFMAANLELNYVAYTRSEVRMGVCVAWPCYVSIGSLPSITVNSVSGGRMVSSIALGDLTPDGDTTVSAFSKAVINNNAGFEEGDKITCFYCKQTVSGEDQIPRVETVTAAITLNKNDNSKLFEATNFDACMGVVEGSLSSKGTVNGGICWIHSRKADGRTLVSTQRLVVNNMLLETYQSNAQLRAAIASYGGVRSSGVLTPDPLESQENPNNPNP